MAHELTIRENGTVEAAFTVDHAQQLDTPWHGLGTLLDHTMTSAEAMSAAQLDWTVEQRPMAIGEIMDGRHATPGIKWHQTDLLANVRGDTGLFLGHVTPAYQVVQNVDAFRFLDALVDEGSMEYVSAFSLRGGKQVLLVSLLPTIDSIVEADPNLRYVLMSLTHDGTGAIKFGPTSVRAVCANTYALALATDSRTIRDLSIRHTGNMDEKLAQAKSILRLANAGFQEHADRARRMAEAKLTAADWTRYLNICCPLLDRADPDWTPRRDEAIRETRRGITQAYLSNRQQLPGIEESAWAAFNAVTDYVDHLPRRGADRTRRAEARFNVTLYGTGRDMKQHAFTAACRLAGIETAA